jgi:hypothetical protein
MKLKLSFTARVWLYPGTSAAWHFVSLPATEAARVHKLQEGVSRRGWGAVRVRAKIGRAAWETSIFPDKKTGSYLLPLKASVRRQEGIFEKDRVGIVLEVG